MSKVPGTLPSTIPLSLVTAWPTIERKAYVSFTRFVEKKITYPLDIEYLAAECGYIPAEQHALSFRGSPYERMSSFHRKSAFVLPIIRNVIAPFLARHDFSTSECLRAMASVTSSASTIPQFTFGNAQKWINMAIKYYLILLAYLPYLATSSRTRFENTAFNMAFDPVLFRAMETSYETTNFYGYELMPIDSPMCRHVTADFGCLPSPIYTPYPWSKNNNSMEFIDYWGFVYSSITSHTAWGGFIPLLYEIYVW